MVLNSQDGETLKKSLGVRKPGGHLISISGPTDPQFADDNKAPWLVKQVMRALSFSVRRQARRRQLSDALAYVESGRAKVKVVIKVR